MATPLNVEVLGEMGFDVPAAATPNDMVVAIRLEPDGDLAAALAAVERALTPARSDGARPGGRAAAYDRDRPARPTRPSRWCPCPVRAPWSRRWTPSTPDCDVMVFSDNVPIEQEVALKRAAAERGLLVMGPDCGTAVVGGLGLGFANATRPGPVGIVAASGTGCQQLLALLDHAGVGVSSALGVGGRDLSAEVGGLSTLEAMRRLDADDEVQLVVVVSKPPAPEVATRIEEYAATLATPVELALLGDGRPDLTAAAEAVLSRLGTAAPGWPVDGHTRRRPRRGDPRPVRRRHAVPGSGRCWPAATADTPSSTSATTPSRRGGPTR